METLEIIVLVMFFFLLWLMNNCSAYHERKERALLVRIEELEMILINHNIH